MAVISVSPFGPTQPARPSGHLLLLTAGTAVLGLLIGVTLFLYALQGSKTGIIATLSATSPVIILPLLWLRTAQRPSGLSWCGAAVAVCGLALISHAREKNFSALIRCLRSTIPPFWE